MFERFTERARQVVVLAQDEARALGHNYIGTEHILLGLLREEEGLAARVFEVLGVTIEEVRAQVARIIGSGDDVTTGQIPFTPRAKKVLEMSMRESRALGHDYIGTEHILLGLARENEGVAAQILLGFDVDAETIRNGVMGMLSDPAWRHAADLFDPPLPPFAPDVAAELARMGAEKERMITERRFEEAAALRDRERRLTVAARSFHAAWESREDSEPRVGTTGGEHFTPSARLRLRPLPRGVATYARPPRDWLPAVAAARWSLFGLAVGVLLGRAIWGSESFPLDRITLWGSTQRAQRGVR